MVSLWVNPSLVLSHFLSLLILWNICYSCPLQRSGGCPELLSFPGSEGSKWHLPSFSNLNFQLLWSISRLSIKGIWILFLYFNSSPNIPTYSRYTSKALILWAFLISILHIFFSSPPFLFIQAIKTFFLSFFLVRANCIKVVFYFQLWWCCQRNESVTQDWLYWSPNPQPFWGMDLRYLEWKSIISLA